MEISKAHQIFYDTTDIEISIPIDKALKKIVAAALTEQNNKIRKMIEEKKYIYSVSVDDLLNDLSDNNKSE